MNWVILSGFILIWDFDLDIEIVLVCCGLIGKINFCLFVDFIIYFDCGVDVFCKFKEFLVLFWFGENDGDVWKIVILRNFEDNDDIGDGVNIDGFVWLVFFFCKFIIDLLKICFVVWCWEGIEVGFGVLKDFFEK